MSCLVFKWRSWLEQGELLLRSKVSIGQWENCTLYILFISIFLVIFFSSPFAVLLNCFYRSPQVLPFSSDSPPHPTGGEEWESNCVVLCCQLGLNHESGIIWTNYQCCSNSRYCLLLLIQPVDFQIWTYSFPCLKELDVLNLWYFSSFFSYLEPRENLREKNKRFFCPPYFAILLFADTENEVNMAFKRRELIMAFYLLWELTKPSFMKDYYRIVYLYLLPQ